MLLQNLNFLCYNNYRFKDPYKKNKKKTLKSFVYALLLEIRVTTAQAVLTPCPPEYYDPLRILACPIPSGTFTSFQQ